MSDSNSSGSSSDSSLSDGWGSDDCAALFLRAAEEAEAEDVQAGANDAFGSEPFGGEPDHPQDEPRSPSGSPPPLAPIRAGLRAQYVQEHDLLESVAVALTRGCAHAGDLRGRCPAPEVYRGSDPGILVALQSARRHWQTVLAHHGGTVGGAAPMQVCSVPSLPDLHFPAGFPQTP